MTQTLQLEKTLGLRIEGGPLHFVVVGAGGTGGHLLPNLIRMIGIKNDSSSTKHSISIIDADVLEEKNLLRQNFTNSDIGKNKAEVMAKRYGRAFGVPVSHIPEYVTSPQELIDMIASSYRLSRNFEILDSNFTADEREVYTHFRTGDLPPRYGRLVLIDATDNNKTRLIMETVLEKWCGSAFLISSGNEEMAGQVIISHHNNNTDLVTERAFDNASGLFSYGLWNTPTFFDIFPQAPVEKLPNELSCAEASVSAPQNILTNITAANIIMNYCNKLLNNMPITNLAVFFDTENMGQKTYRFNKSGLVDLLSIQSGNDQAKKFLKKKTVEKFLSEEELAIKPTWEEVQAKYLEEKKQEAERVQAIIHGNVPAEM